MFTRLIAGEGIYPTRTSRKYPSSDVRFSALTTEFSSHLSVSVVYKPDADYSLAFDDTMEKFIFPTRWVTYRNENQLKTVQEPNDVDNAKLGEFAQYVASIGGKLPDSSSFGFGCKKDTHPSQDWGDVSSGFLPLN